MWSKMKRISRFLNFCISFLEIFQFEIILITLLPEILFEFEFNNNVRKLLFLISSWKKNNKGFKETFFEKLFPEISDFYYTRATTQNIFHSGSRGG